MDVEKEKKEISQQQRTLYTHVNSSGSNILAGGNHEGNLRAADRSAFQKFQAAAKHIIVTKDVLDLLQGASHNLREAQKQYEEGTLLPSQTPAGQIPTASLPLQQQPLPAGQSSSPAAQAAAGAAGQISPSGISGNTAGSQSSTAAGSCGCPPANSKGAKKNEQTEKADWGYFRMLSACRVAPSAGAAVRFSPEGSPRPDQPGLSVDEATRASWESWQLMTEEQAVEARAETGWRHLLKEKRAKMRSRHSELDIRHAAARMIQATWRLHHHRLVRRATAEFDRQLSRASTMHRSGSVTPLSPLSRHGSCNATKDRCYMYERPADELPAAAMAAKAAAMAAAEAAAAADDGDWHTAMAAAAAETAAAAAAARSESPPKERKNNVGAYEVKPRVKPAGRPQPMSVAVGRDGLAIETAMPKAKKKGVPKWRAAAHTAMAFSGLGASQRETDVPRNGSQDGCDAEARSCSVSQTGTTATSRRSSTENPAAVDAQAGSCNVSQGGRAAASCRSSKENAASLQVQYRNSPAGAAAGSRRNSTDDATATAAAQVKARRPSQGSTAALVAGPDFIITSAAAAVAVTTAADIPALGGPLERVEPHTTFSASAPSLVSDQRPWPPNADSQPSSQNNPVQFALSGQKAAVSAATGHATVEWATVQQRQQPLQPALEQQSLACQQDVYLGQPAQQQQLQRERQQGQLKAVPAQLFDTAVGTDASNSNSSERPLQHKLTKVQINIQHKLDSLIPELSVRRAVQQNTPNTLGVESSGSGTAAPSGATLLKEAATARHQKHTAALPGSASSSSEAAAPTVARALQEAAAAVAMQQSTAAAPVGAIGSSAAIAATPAAMPLEEGPAAAVAGQKSAAAGPARTVDCSAAVAAPPAAMALGKQFAAAVAGQQSTAAPAADTPGGSTATAAIPKTTRLLEEQPAAAAAAASVVAVAQLSTAAAPASLHSSLPATVPTARTPVKEEVAAALALQATVKATAASTNGGAAVAAPSEVATAKALTQEVVVNAAMQNIPGVHVSASEIGLVDLVSSSPSPSPSAAAAAVGAADDWGGTYNPHHSSLGSQECIYAHSPSVQTVAGLTAYAKLSSESEAEERQAEVEQQLEVKTQLEAEEQQLEAEEQQLEAEEQQAEVGQQLQLEALSDQHTQPSSSSSSFCSCKGQLCEAGQDQLVHAVAATAAPASPSAAIEDASSTTWQAAAAAQAELADRTERRSESWFASVSLSGGVPVARAIGEAVMSFAGGIVAAAAAAGSSSSSGAADGPLYRGSSLSLTGGWFASKVAKASVVETQPHPEVEVLWPAVVPESVQLLQLQPQHQHQQEQEQQELDVQWMHAQSQQAIRTQASQQSGLGTAVYVQQVLPGNQASLQEAIKQQLHMQQLSLDALLQLAAEASQRSQGMQSPTQQQQQQQQLCAKASKQLHTQQLSLDALPQLAAESSQGSQGLFSPTQQQQQQQQAAAEEAKRLHTQQLSLAALSPLTTQSSQASPKQLSPKQQQQRSRAYGLLQPSTGPQGLEFVPYGQQQSPNLSPSVSPRGGDSSQVSTQTSVLKPLPPRDASRPVGHSPRMIMLNEPPAQVAHAGLKALLLPAAVAAAVADSGSCYDLQPSMGDATDAVGCSSTASNASKNAVKHLAGAPQKVSPSAGLCWNGIVPPTAKGSSSSNSIEGVFNAAQLAFGAPMAPKEHHSGKAHSLHLPRSKSPGLKGIIPPSATPEATAATLNTGNTPADAVMQYQQQQQLMVGGSSSSAAPVSSPKEPVALAPLSPSPPGNRGLIAVAAVAALATVAADKGSSSASSTVSAISQAAAPGGLLGGFAQGKGAGFSPRVARGTLVSPTISSDEGKESTLSSGAGPGTAAAAATTKTLPAAAGHEATSSSDAGSGTAAATTARTAAGGPVAVPVSSTGQSRRAAPGVLLSPRPSNATAEGKTVAFALPAALTAVAAVAHMVQQGVEDLDGPPAQHAKPICATAAHTGPPEAAATSPARAVAAAPTETTNSDFTIDATAAAAGSVESSGPAFEPVLSAEEKMEAVFVKQASASSAGPQLSSLGQKLAVARRMSQNIAGTALSLAHQLDGSSNSILHVPPHLAAAAAAGEMLMGSNAGRQGTSHGKHGGDMDEDGITAGFAFVAGADSTHQPGSGSGSDSVRPSSTHAARVHYTTMEASLAPAALVTASEQYSGSMRRTSASGNGTGSIGSANSSSRRNSSSGVGNICMSGVHGKLQPALLVSPTADSVAAAQQHQLPVGDCTIPLKQRISSSGNLAQLEQQLLEPQGCLAGRLSNVGVTPSLVASKGPSPVMQLLGTTVTAPAPAGRLAPAAAAMGVVTPAAAGGGAGFIPIRSPVPAQMTWQRPVNSIAYSGNSSPSSSANVSRGSSPLFGIPTAAAAATAAANVLMPAADGSSSAAAYGSRRISLAAEGRTASDPHFDITMHLKSFGDGNFAAGATAGAAQLRHNAASGSAVGTEGMTTGRAVTPPPNGGSGAGTLLPALNNTRRKTAM